MNGFAELAEAEASGRIATLYAEIRAAYAAPYVSSLHRHLATYPGVLEWFWGTLAPAFTARSAQHLAWSRADVSELPPLPALGRPALRLLGIGAEAEDTLANVLRTFARVSPVNLVFGACVRALLGETPRTAAAEDVTEGPPLPEPLAPVPPLVPMERLPGDVRAVLACFATDHGGHGGHGGRPFVPGLYRMLARWPAYLAHVSAVLAPYLSDPAVGAACGRIADRIADAHVDVLAALPPPASPPPVDAQQQARILAAVATYRVTSPQMVGFSTLLLDALPGTSATA